MSKRIRLTKKRKETLNIAISLDDILYEQFRRLNEDLDRRYRALYRAERVIQVIREVPGAKAHERLQIVSVQISPEGTQVIVR